jgi:riboflavin kinase/FMN adenylyltransferase
MNIWSGLAAVTPPIERSVVTVGVFDGVHLGHQSLLSATTALARACGCRSVAVTFEDHPLTLTDPSAAPRMLQTLGQRLEAMQRCGLDDAVVVRFEEPFRRLTPEGFARFVLKGLLGAEHVYVGPDFRYGHRGAGSIETLIDSGYRLGFCAEAVPPASVDGIRVSSTRIREAVAAGQVEQASAMLGRYFALSGTVVRGNQLGRTLGFPTANLAWSDRQIIPADGIYAVWAHTPYGRSMGACSIGMRPTVQGTHRTVETFLLHFSEDLYGCPMEIEFVQRMRDELKFDSLDTLVEQMGRDVQEIETVLTASR